jgi:hypothetical protein
LTVYKDTDPTLENPNFWNELFLLRVNTPWLSGWIEVKTAMELKKLQVVPIPAQLTTSPTYEA